MDATRRTLVGLAGSLPAMALAREVGAARAEPAPLILSDFDRDEPRIISGAQWRGFSDRVMGGVSDASLDRDLVDGRRCIRLTGRVTRDNGGGFIQMAMYLRGPDGGFDASSYRGIEIDVYGNDEDYNVHIRTADCGWHDESYRATFRAVPEWQTIRLPWSAFKPNSLTAPLDTRRLQRIGLLGWMREFRADLSLAHIALYA